MINFLKSLFHVHKWIHSHYVSNGFRNAEVSRCYNCGTTKIDYDGGDGKRRTTKLKNAKVL